MCDCVCKARFLNEATGWLVWDTKQFMVLGHLLTWPWQYVRRLFLCSVRNYWVRDVRKSLVTREHINQRYLLEMWSDVHWYRLQKLGSRSTSPFTLPTLLTLWSQRNSFTWEISPFYKYDSFFLFNLSLLTRLLTIDKTSLQVLFYRWLDNRDLLHVLNSYLFLENRQ